MRVSPSVRRWLLVAFKLLILVAVLIFVGRTIQRGWEELGEQAWRIDWHWLIAGGALYFLGLVPSAWFWWQSMWALGGTPPLLVTGWAYLVGHLAKYVPGKALVVILRTGLLPRDAIAKTPAVVCIFLETLTLMAVGAFWAALLTAFVRGGRPEIIVGAVIMMIAAGVPTFPPVARALARLTSAVAGVGKQDENRIDASSLEGISFKLVVTGWIAGTISWLMFAWSLWCVIRSLGVASADPLSDLPLWMTAVTMSVVGGFVSFLPGGLGVRDALLVALLAPTVGDGNALLVAVLVRLVSIVAELVGCGILYALVNRDSRRQHSTT